MDNRTEQLKWFARGFKAGSKETEEISARETLKRNPSLPFAMVDHYTTGFSDGVRRDNFRMKLNGLI